jgi:hypothetical protein
MIMAGVLQQRQSFNDCNRAGDYYHSAWFLYDVYCLLPVEAKEKLRVSPPPSGKDKDSMTPDVKIACRKWIEENRAAILNAIPLYVYQYFERGRQAKSGY